MQKPDWMMPKFPFSDGDYTGEGTRTIHALLLLIDLYRNNQQFMRGLTELHSLHADSVHFIKSEHKNLHFPTSGGGLDYSFNGLGLLYDRPRLRDLIKSATAFGVRWGLDAPWATGMLIKNLMYGHRCEGDLGAESWEHRFFAGAAISWEPIYEDVAPPDAWNPINFTRQHYLNMINTYMDDVEEVCREARMERKGGKTEIWAHTQWLYMAICPDPKKGRGLRYNEIVTVGEIERPALDPGSVGRAVRNLANSLRLELPTQRGRPVK